MNPFPVNVRLCLTLLLFAAALPSISTNVAAQATSTDYMVEMRDGVKLATTVYIPEGEGPWPVVLTRTPYNKGVMGRSNARYTAADYVFAIQDCRGRFASEGEYIPFDHARQDGYDTIEWLAKQDFCNGKIGMSGASAMGITTNQAAAADPPHLVAGYAIVAPHSRFNESTFVGGVFKDADIGGWMKMQGAGDQVPALKARVVLDDGWRKTDLSFHIQNIDIPMYNVGGWYDIFQQGNLQNFMYLQAKGRGDAKGNQKLFMGAFGHGALSGDLEYPGAGSLFGTGDEELRWFDHWLKGEDNGIDKEPPVKYYMMAAARKGALSDKNRFITADTWPPESTPTRFYLTKGFGLSTTAPTEVEAPTTYSSDPANPVPTFGGANLTIDRGPMDQRQIGDRPDYLRFETPVLERDVVIAGKIDVELFVATDGPDTDFMIKLVDVYPDGYEALVNDAPIRARYRNGRKSAADVKLMTPNEPTKLVIDLWSSAITFEAGHRIAIHIASSNSPRFDVNPNTDEAPGKSEIPPRVARNTIYHDAQHLSAVILPVIEQ